MYYIYLLDNSHLYVDKHIVMYRNLLKEIIYSPPHDERLDPTETYDSLLFLSIE